MSAVRGYGQAFVIARHDYLKRLRRQAETCDDKGHSVHWVGPYRICRTLTCSTLVVETAR